MKKIEKSGLDIERIIASKNPVLLRWAPKFLLKYLKRILHEEDVNRILKANEGVKGIPFSQYVVKDFNIEIVAHGKENVPKENGVILAINHPLGGMDAMTLISEFVEIRKDYKFIVNDLLLNLENLKDMFVGLNKHGKNSKDSLRALNDLFASEMAVLLFPAGLVSRKTGGKTEDLTWKKTFITRSKMYKRDVVPVHIDGELSSFFYRLSNFRRAIGIKANIEMLYLLNEMYKLKGRKITLHFGEPIPYQTFDKSKKDIEWAQWVKAKAYKLKD